MERKRNMEPKLNNGQLVEAFASYLEVEKDDSPLTIANYEADIRHFTDFMATRSEDAAWPAITVLDIRSYLALVRNLRGGPLPGGFLRSVPSTDICAGRESSGPIRLPRYGPRNWKRSCLYFWKNSKSICCCGCRM